VGHIHLRVEEIAPTEAAAADTTESMQTILTLVKSMDNAAGGTPVDPQMQSMVDSILVERHSDRAILTATIPTPLLEHMLNSPQDMRVMPVPGAEAHR
jgi:hypothetical protein